MSITKRIAKNFRFILRILCLGIITVSTFSAGVIVQADVNYQLGKPIEGQVFQQYDGTASATVLLLDTSGSMDDMDITGYTKMAAAKNAAGSILDVILAEQALITTQNNQVGLVEFNSTATIGARLTNDLDSVQMAIDRLFSQGMTAMADGLDVSIDMLKNVDRSYSRTIILLSDGLPNFGLNGNANAGENEIIDELLTLARNAKSEGICIDTVGLGLPQEGSVNEDLLKQIASESGCGNYYNAETASDLTNAFIEIRHRSMGEILLSDKGKISQNEVLDLGAVEVEKDQELVLFTVNSLGTLLDLRVTDPSGREVNASYPNAKLTNTTSLSSLVVSEPAAGDWKINIVGSNVPDGRSDYYMLMSSRAIPEHLLQPTVTPTLPPTATPAPQTSNVFTAPKANGLLFSIFFILFGGLVGLIIYSVSTNEKLRIKPPTRPVLMGNSMYTQGHQIPLLENFVIGRGSSANLRLEGSDISRIHARFYHSPDGWYIQDLNSKLGTYVNGRPVNIAKLSPGDNVSIGRYTWVFRVD